MSCGHFYEHSIKGKFVELDEEWLIVMTQLMSGKAQIISRRGILRKDLHAFFLRSEMMKELNIEAISAEHTDSYPHVTQPSGKTHECVYWWPLWNLYVWRSL